MSAFGSPPSLDMSAALAGKLKPAGLVPGTKSAPEAGAAAPKLGSGLLRASAAKSARPALGAGLLRAQVARPAPSVAAKPARPALGAGLLRAQVARPAPSITPTERVTTGAKVSIAPSVVSAAKTPGTAAAAARSEEVPVETLVWSAADIPEAVDVPETVQPTAFFLSPHHKVLLGSESACIRVAVTALLNIGADLSASRPSPASRQLSIAATLAGETPCEITLSKWSLPSVEGFAPGLAMELTRRAGDRYAFHDAVLRFNLALAAAAEEAGVPLAQDVCDPRVAPLSKPSTAWADSVSAAMPSALAGFEGTGLPAPRSTSAAPPAAPAPAAATVAEELPEGEAAALEESCAESYRVMASMLESPYESIRQEGADRAVRALVRADEGASGVCPEACRSALRSSGISTKLVRALVRAQCSSSCHAQAATALARLATCNDCAADMVSAGAVEALSGVVMQPCERQTIRLRRSAARALQSLAADERAAPIAIRTKAVAYLRLAATTCEDATFRVAAAEAADALDPERTVLASDAAGANFQDLSRQATCSALDAVSKLGAP